MRTRTRSAGNAEGTVHAQRFRRRMTPFLKWAGGKRWLVKQLKELLPLSYGTYVEPFLGSGAIFFELCTGAARLSDVNFELIETYVAIRDEPSHVFDILKTFHTEHCESFYYRTRASVPDDRYARAARFVYLNRTCWNGLYRVNRKNEFNVPIGTKSSVIFIDDDFVAISEALSRATISACDFSVSIDATQGGDLIYVDPPYTVKHNMNGFIKYNQTLFSWDDQMRLRDCLVRARDRGCHVVISNADHSSVRDLYADFEFVQSIGRASVIAGAASARAGTSELLVAHVHG